MSGLRAFGQDLQNPAVGKQPIPLSSRDFPSDAQPNQDPEGLIDGRGRQPFRSSDRVRGTERSALKVVMNLQCGAGAAPGFLESLAVLGKQTQQPLHGKDRTFRSLGNALEKEVQPGLPVAVGADGLEQVIVRRSLPPRR